MWDWLFGPEEHSRNYTANMMLLTQQRQMMEYNPMCGRQYTPAKKEDPDAIKANQVWYINGASYVVLQPLAKYLRQTDGEQTPYVVIREQGGSEVELLTIKRFNEIATRTPPEVKRYITFEEIIAAKPCWQGAIDAYALFSGYRYSCADDLEKDDWFAFGKLVGQSEYKKMLVADLFTKYRELRGTYPHPAYLSFVARTLKLIPAGTNQPYETLKRLLGIK